MIKLREYKSVISSVILTTFISLHCSWTFIRCSEGHSNEIENQKEINNKNKIDHIINETKDKYAWTLFKIIITPGEGVQNIDNLKIEDIVSKEYINNENNENNEPNAFFLSEEEAQKIGINNNENDKNDKKDNNKNTYYVLVKDITTKKDEYELNIPFFKNLQSNAQKNKFTYTIEIFAANTTGVEDMGHMFYRCVALTKIVGLNNWDTGNVTDMSYMFGGCEKLTEIKGLDNWNTKSVTNMEGMFWGCEKLTEKKFGDNWNTENVTNMSWMFCGCEKLTEIKFGDNWNTGDVKDMSNMFYNCKVLKFEKQDFKLIIPQQCVINNIIDECENLSLKGNCIQNKES